MARVKEKGKLKGEPRVLTSEEVENLIKSVKKGLGRHIADIRMEEPGLSGEARHFVIKY